MSKKISEILTEMGLDSENQLKLENAIKALVDEKSALKIEEATAAITLENEEKFQTALKDAIEANKAELLEAAERWQKDFEAETVDNLDAFLDSEINENISEAAIEKIAVNEVLKPVVDGVLKVFSENFINVDTEGGKTLKEHQEKNEKLIEENSNLINEKLELSKLCDKSASELRMRDAIVGLNEDQEKRVKMFFEGKDFNEIDSKIDGFVKIVLEEKNTEDNKKGEDEKENLNEQSELETNEDRIPEKKPEVKTDSLIDNACNLLD